MTHRLPLLLALACCVGWAAVAAPTIAIDDPVFATTARAGDMVSHSFVVTNLGDEPLTITDVYTSCGCTTAALATNSLAPGETVRLDATVNTQGFRGVVTRTVTLVSNDPTTPSAVLQIVVTIPDSVQPVVPEITPADLEQVLYLLIDVRTPEEFAAGHLIGAMNIPLLEFQTNLAQWLPRLPREVPLILYCQAGVRSLQAATLLVDAGLTNVRNLTGGITQWQSELGPRFLFAT